MKTWRSPFLALLTLAALTSAPAAQQPEPAAEQEIVVTGERLREIARDFVAEIAAPPGSEDQLARWDRRICPGVIGLRDRATAQAIVDRLAQRAFEIGLDVAGPGCRADVIVFITPNSDALATELGNTFKDLLNARSTSNTATLGQEALNDFMTTTRTVRWWSVSQTTTADGFIIDEATGDRIPQVRVFGPSRLRRPTRQDFSRIIVVIDATRAQGVATAALADYVAMVSLAQIEMDADPSAYDTILNLFAERETRPAAMTEWDIAYLRGLYDSTRNARNSRQQVEDISREMAEELEDAP